MDSVTHLVAVTQHRRVPTERRAWIAILVVSAAVAAVSLLVIPRTLGYDPWSWLVWGREIDHLQLNTRNAATAMKPFPVLVDTVLASTGSAAPVLWLLVARTGALVALALAWMLGFRLGGWGAAALSLLGLALAQQYLGYLFVDGMSEPTATAAVLAAGVCWTSGHRNWGVGWLVVAALLRPEAWPFLILAAFAQGLHRSLRRGLAAAVLACAVPASWFVLDWFGSGSLLRSAGAASRQSQGGPLLTREPGLATIREVWHILPPPLVVLFLVALARGAWQRSRRRPTAPSTWVALAAAAWVVVAAVMAQLRIATGASRYLLPAAALAAVVAASTAVDLCRVAVRRFDRVAAAALVATGGVALVVSAVPHARSVDRQDRTDVTTGRRGARVQHSLSTAVADAGGRRAVLGCGQVSTEAFQVPFVAWELRVPVGHVASAAWAPGTILETADKPVVPPPLDRYFHQVATVTAAGADSVTWRVLRTCTPSP
jgi:hypothetical protein